MQRQKWLDRAEVDRLRSYWQGRGEAAMRLGRFNDSVTWMVVDMALTTGLRASELCGLEVRDFDPHLSTLQVSRAKKKALTIDEMVLPPALVEHLQEYLGDRTDGALLMGRMGPYTRRGISTCFRRACIEAGLRPKRIHTARHTLAVHLLKHTRNLRHVQKQLGHSSPTTTANMYADVSFEDMQAALEEVYA
jgi:integrase